MQATWSKTANSSPAPRSRPAIILTRSNVQDITDEPRDSRTYYVGVHDLRLNTEHGIPLKMDGYWLSPQQVPYDNLIRGRYLATASLQTDTDGFPSWYDVHYQR